MLSEQGHVVPWTRSCAIRTGQGQSSPAPCHSHCPDAQPNGDKRQDGPQQNPKQDMLSTFKCLDIV